VYFIGKSFINKSSQTVVKRGAECYHSAPLLDLNRNSLEGRLLLSFILILTHLLDRTTSVSFIFLTNTRFSGGIDFFL